MKIVKLQIKFILLIFIFIYAFGWSLLQKTVIL